MSRLPHFVTTATASVLVWLFVIPTATNAIKLERCEFLETLRTQGSLKQAAIFTCIAERLTSIETNRTTEALGEKYYGLFQINSKYWCSVDGGCGISCENLLDDTTEDDIKCAYHVYEETLKIKEDGFLAWPSYDGCKGQEQSILSSCGLVEENVITNRIDDSDSDSGKVYEKCELARELVHKFNVQFDKVGTMVCIANEESHFNTSAVGRLNKDGSRDFGIFQISEKFWCSERTGGGGCNKACSKFLDTDIADDVACFKQIFDETARFSASGFEAWAVYNREKNHCRDMNQAYVEECFNDPTEGKIFGICELIEEMRGKIPDDLLADFACVALYESGLSTGVYNWGHHGIFQISEQKWCSTLDDLPKGCDVPCGKLRDMNITDDIACVKRIHTLLGFDPWPSYRPYCKDKAYEMVQGCPNIPRPKRINEDNYYLIQISDAKQVKRSFQIRKSQLKGNFIKIAPTHSQEGISVTIESENEI